MLHRFAVGLRRFFKFSYQKNRLPVEPIAEPVSGLYGKEKKTDQHSEPKGSMKFVNILLPEIQEKIKQDRLLFESNIDKLSESINSFKPGTAKVDQKDHQEGDQTSYTKRPQFHVWRFPHVDGEPVCTFLKPQDFSEMRVQLLKSTRLGFLPNWLLRFLAKS